MRRYLIWINLIVLSCFYIGAGINHFWHPVAYIAIIPPYFPFHPFLVFLSGVIEIVLGVMLFFSQFRKVAVILIIMMLIAFIPVHVFMIQVGGCVTSTICIPLWLAWIRLFPLQFIFIWWAWKSYQWSKPQLPGL